MGETTILFLAVMPRTVIGASSRGLVSAIESPRVGKDVPLNNIEAALSNRFQIFFSPTRNVKRNPRSFVMCR